MRWKIDVAGPLVADGPENSGRKGTRAAEGGDADDRPRPVSRGLVDLTTLSDPLFTTGLLSRF